MKTETKTKRILFVTHGVGLYGSERCMLNLLGRLDRNRYAPVVVIRGKKGGLADALEHLKIKFYIYPLDQWIAYADQYSFSHFYNVVRSLPARLRLLTELIERENIDLVYSNSMIVFDGALAARIRNVPHVTHIHEILKGEPFLKPYLPICLINTLVKSLSNRIVVVSQAVARSLSKKAMDKIRVVYNGIDADRFSPGAGGTGLRQALGVKGDEKLIGLIGRFIESKGHGDFIAAASMVIRDVPGVKFVIIGSGAKEMEALWRTKVAEHHLQDHFSVVGFRQDVVDVYQSLDIVVSASWIDPFPLTILEAMAMQKPIIATRCGGPEESVMDGVTGVLVPPHSPVDLAEAIMRLIRHPDLCQKMGMSGHQRVRDFFTLDRYVDKLQETIQEAMA